MKDIEIEEINKAWSDLEELIKKGVQATESLSKLRRKYHDLMEDHPNTEMIRDLYAQTQSTCCGAREGIFEMQCKAALIHKEVMSTIYNALQDL